jgi:hypothetical protein
VSRNDYLKVLAAEDSNPFMETVNSQAAPFMGTVNPIEKQMPLKWRINQIARSYRL